MLHKFTVPMIISLSVVVLSSCSPKDEKVSTVGQRGGQQQSDQDLPSGFPDRNDRTPEYATAMLFDVAEVARELEVALHAIDDEGNSTNSGTASSTVTPSCIKTSRLKAPEGTVKLVNRFEDCKDTGSVFDASQRGVESVFAVITNANANGIKRATVVHVAASGLSKMLVPLKNKRDSVQLRQFRSLESELIAEKDGVLTYQVFYESDSTYRLNLKSFLDNGSLYSSVRGYLDVDARSKRVSRFWTDDANRKLAISVKSERTPRGGRNTLRQEIYASAQPSELTIDLPQCLAPQGALRMRFSIRSFGRDVQAATDGGKKYFFDKESDFVSKAEADSVCSQGDDRIATSAGMNGLLF